MDSKLDHKIFAEKTPSQVSEDESSNAEYDVQTPEWCPCLVDEQGREPCYREGT